MLERMSEQQFNEWCAYDLLEPIGTTPVNEILSRIGAIISAFAGHAVDPEDFMPWSKRKVEAKLSPKQSRAFVAQQLQIAKGNG
jgi:hypothetical protein